MEPNQTNPPAHNTSVNANGKISPDEATLTRLENLAPVGDLLMEVSNDLSEDTYFLAKSSLDKYKAGLLQLEVPPKTMNGMLNLVKYLETKIEKRSRQSHGEFSKD